LHDLCERKLRGFPTSIEEDEEALRGLERGKSAKRSDATLESSTGSLLKEAEEEAEEAEDGSREGNLVLAVQWRLCQKRVLRKAMRTCRLYQTHLSERPELYPQ